MNREDALVFIKQLKQSLVKGGDKKSASEDNKSAPSKTEKGEKRGREESDEKGDRDTEGRFVNNNKAAKKSRESSPNDAIKAINAIYSENSKIPTALRNVLAGHVCQSYGWTIDSSIFSAPAAQGEETPAAQKEEALPEEAKSEEKQQTPAPVGASIPTQQPQQTSFDLHNFSQQEVLQSLSTAWQK